jgi:LuxR family transcriptional regulator, maltose regulon positive regulatory protein
LLRKTKMTAPAETLTFARTKIQPPRLRGGLILRDALIEQIAEGLQHARLTLLSAAGGFGKSCALAQTLSAHSKTLRSAWIGCETSDTLSRFASALVAAFDPFDPPWRNSPEALVAAIDTPDGQRVFRDALVNALASTDGMRGVIVLDDFHRLQDNALIEFVSTLPERLPEKWGLAIVSREDPPWSLVRLRIANDITEIRQDDLRFVANEIDALAKVAGKTASAQELLSRTEGWAVGVTLALASDGKGSLMRSERQAIEYLQSEVLAAVPDELRAFLVHSSVLPELTATRCAAVTARENSDECLDDIERRGLFFQAVEGHERTLRLHDIFRDALAQLRDRLPAEERFALWRRAAESESDATRRIEYLIAAQEFEAATTEFARTAPVLITAGLSDTAHAMLRRFPSTVAQSSPELSILRGLMAWESMQLDAMLEHMKQARAEFERRGDTNGRDLATAYVSLTIAGSAPIGESRTDPAYRITIDDKLPPVTRAIASLDRAWEAFDLADFDATNAHYNDALLQVPKANDPSLWFQLLPGSGYMGLRPLEPLLSRYSNGAIAAAGETYVSLRAVGLGVRGGIAMWRGELDAARASLDEAASLAAWINHSINVCFYSIVPLSWCRALQGELDVSRQLLHEAIGHTNQSDGTPSGSAWYFHWMELRCALIADRDDVAREAIVSIWKTIRPESYDRHAGVVTIVEAVEAMLDHRYDIACDRIQRTIVRYGNNDANSIVTMVSLLHARILSVMNDHEGALINAKRALDFIATRGYPTSARFGGTRAIELIATPAFAERYDDTQRATLAEVVAQMRSQLPYALSQRNHERDASQREGSVADDRSDGAPDYSSTRSVAAAAHEAISPREMEVLELIASGESNKVIARRLDLSPHTVKRHVANILGKLAVDSRGQAAARYRELISDRA